MNVQLKAALALVFPASVLVSMKAVPPQARSAPLVICPELKKDQGPELKQF
jgi:hypothetical protein